MMDSRELWRIARNRVNAPMYPSLKALSEVEACRDATPPVNESWRALYTAQAENMYVMRHLFFAYSE